MRRGVRPEEVEMNLCGITKDGGNRTTCIEVAQRRLTQFASHMETKSAVINGDQGTQGLPLLLPAERLLTHRFGRMDRVIDLREESTVSPFQFVGDTARRDIVSNGLVQLQRVTRRPRLARFAWSLPGHCRPPW